MATLLLLVLITSACERDVVEPPIPCPAIVIMRVTPSQLAVSPGASAHLRATYSQYVSTGRECELVELDGPFMWSSSDTAVARVDSLGFVVGVKAGQAMIVAAWRENPVFRVAATLTVVPWDGGT